MWPRSNFIHHNSAHVRRQSFKMKVRGLPTTVHVQAPGPSHIYEELCLEQKPLEGRVHRASIKADNGQPIVTASRGTEKEHDTGSRQRGVLLSERAGTLAQNLEKKKQQFHRKETGQVVDITIWQNVNVSRCTCSTMWYHCGYATYRKNDKRWLLSAVMYVRLYIKILT